MVNELKQHPENMNDSDSNQEDEEAVLLPTLSVDLVLEIFSYLPPKSLFRFKSVSKSLRDSTKEVDFISKYAFNALHSIPRSSSFTGLFYHTRTPTLHPKVEFLPTESGMELPGLNFLKQKQRRSEVHGIGIIDSCNGMLLCWTATNGYHPVKGVHVCNPLTGEKVTIPHPRRRSKWVRYALLSDSTDLGLNRFAVVCLHDRRDIHQMNIHQRNIHGTELLIYSSETGEWDAQPERLPVLSEYGDKGSKVFFNGSLFWDCFHDHILVCHHVNVPKSSRVCYELIEAPKPSYLRRCLVKFDQKLICHCHKYVHDWCLRDSHWERFRSCPYFRDLKEDIRLCDKRGLNLRPWDASHYDIIGFDQKSNTMFLVVEKSIVSYHVKRRWFEIMVGEPLSTRRINASRNSLVDGRVATYTHSLVKILRGKGEEDGKERKRVDRRKKYLHVVKDDLDDSASLIEKNANMVKQRGRRRR